jgi:hypothetical protein
LNLSEPLSFTTAYADIGNPPIDADDISNTDIEAQRLKTVQKTILTHKIQQEMKGLIGFLTDFLFR